MYITFKEAVHSLNAFKKLKLSTFSKRSNVNKKSFVPKKSLGKKRKKPGKSIYSYYLLCVKPQVPISLYVAQCFECVCASGIVCGWVRGHCM